MSALIGPESRLGPLLDDHPELEETLIALSPEFKRLRNPVLRRTVARVATVAQAARIGGLPVARVVAALREALGQPPDPHQAGAGDLAAFASAPAWTAVAPEQSLDAEAILAGGGSPVGDLLKALAACRPGGVVAVRAPFFPAPLVDVARRNGHEVHGTDLGSGAWEVLIRRG